MSGEVIFKILLAILYVLWVVEVVKCISLAERIEKGG